MGFNLETEAEMWRRLADNWDKAAKRVSDLIEFQQLIAPFTDEQQIAVDVCTRFNHKIHNAIRRHSLDRLYELIPGNVVGWGILQRYGEMHDVDDRFIEELAEVMSDGVDYFYWNCLYAPYPPPAKVND